MKILTSLAVLLFMISQIIFDLTDGQMMRSSGINKDFESETFRAVFAKVQVPDDEDLLSTFNNSFNKIRSLDLSHFVFLQGGENMVPRFMTNCIEMHSEGSTEVDSNHTILMNGSGKNPLPTYFENQLSKIGVISGINCKDHNLDKNLN